MAAEHKFLSSYEIFTKIDHILGHRIHPTNLKEEKLYNVCPQTALELHRNNKYLENPQILEDSTTHY